MPVPVVCSCGKQLRVPDAYAGKRVKCPACAQPISVPGDAGGEPAAAASSARATAAAAPAKVSFKCSCGQVMQAKLEHAGLKTKCPSCETVVTIPSKGGKSEALATAPARTPPPRTKGGRQDEEDSFGPGDEDDVPRSRKRRNDKARRRSKMPMVLVASALLLLIAGGVTAYFVWFRGGSGGAGEDLALIPGDAQFCATIQVADFFKSEMGQKAMAQLKALPGDPLGKMKKEDGMEVTDIERFTIVGANVMQESVYGIMNFSKPIDREKTLRQLGPTQTAEHAGRKYDVVNQGGDRIAFHFATSKQVLVGNDAGMKKALEMLSSKRKPGPIDDAIKLVSGKHHITMAAAIPPELTQMMGGGMGMGGGQPMPKGPGGPKGPPGGGFGGGPPGMGGGVPGMESITKAKAFGMALDFNKKLDAEVIVLMVDDKASADAKKSIDGLMGLAAMFLPGIKPDLQRSLGNEVGDKVFNQVSEAVKSIKTEANGPKLVVRASADVQAIADAVAPAIPKLMMGGLGGGFPPGPGPGPGFGPGPGPGPGFEFPGGGAANKVAHSNNLKQLILAMHIYADMNRKFPPAYLPDKTGKPGLSWRVAILPYIEQQALYKQFKLDEPWNSPDNFRLLAKMPKTFAIPGGSGFKTSYQLFVGDGTPWKGDGREGLMMPAGFTDGMSNTIAIAEAAKEVEWTKPEDMQLAPGVDPKTLLGQKVNPGKFFFAMADGSVAVIPATVSDQTLRNAINPADGQPLGADWAP